MCRKKALFEMALVPAMILSRSSAAHAPDGSFIKIDERAAFL
jgi:hypothetical protein